MTAKKFTDEIKRVRQVEKKSMILIPQHLNKDKFIDCMWSFKENKYMY